MNKNNDTDKLAAMIQREFAQVHDEINEFKKDSKKNHELTRREISHLNFLMTEHVRKEDYIKLECRVEKLESKVGI